MSDFADVSITNKSGTIQQKCWLGANFQHLVKFSFAESLGNHLSMINVVFGMLRQSVWQ